MRQNTKKEKILTLMASDPTLDHTEIARRVHSTPKSVYAVMNNERKARKSGSLPSRPNIRAKTAKPANTATLRVGQNQSVIEIANGQVSGTLTINTNGMEDRALVYAMMDKVMALTGE